MSKNVWSFVTRGSRSLPQHALTKAQAAAKSGTLSQQQQQQQQQQQAQLRDFPNQRVARIFLQHLPYKTIASTFAYVAPRQGPQDKYGLFKGKKQ